MIVFHEAHQPTLLTRLVVGERVGRGEAITSRDRLTETGDREYEGATNSGRRRREFGKLTKDARKGYHPGVQEETRDKERERIMLEYRSKIRPSGERQSLR